MRDINGNIAFISNRVESAKGRCRVDAYRSAMEQLKAGTKAELRRAVILARAAGVDEAWLIRDLAGEITDRERTKAIRSAPDWELCFS